jgi:hypothetical protein
MAITSGSTRYPDRTAPSTGTGGQRILGRWKPLEALRDMITRSMWTDATAYVRPRGLAIPIDPWMRGTPRFAVRLGGQGSLWRPDIFATTTIAAVAGDNALDVDHLPVDAVEGSLLQVNPTQRAVLTYVSQTRLVLSETLQQPIAAGSRLRVHAWPVTIEEPKASGTSTVRIASPLFLTPGDQIEIPVTAGTYQQAVRLTLTKVDLVEVDTEGYKYQVTTDRAFARALSSDEVVYARAYPAYFSSLVPIPAYGTRALRPVGPFLIDWASGPLTKDAQYEEQVTYRLYRSDRTAITSYLAGSHNAQAAVASIRADQLMFWDCSAGSIAFAGNCAYATCDSEGHFRLSTRLAPAVVPPLTHATGSITAVAKSEFLDYETLVVGLTTFEFRVSTAFTPTPGNIIVDLRFVTTPEQVAAVISAAIASGIANLDIKTVGIETQLVAKVPGILGNVTMTETVAAVGFRVLGVSGGSGGLSWITMIQSMPSTTFPAGTTCYVRLHPNTDVDSILTGNMTTVITTLAPDDQPALAIDFRIKSDPGTIIRIYDWWARESPTVFIEHNTVVRLEQDDWAGSCLFVKPFWPSFDTLRPDPRGEPTNAGAVIL